VGLGWIEALMLRVESAVERAADEPRPDDRADRLLAMGGEMVG